MHQVVPRVGVFRPPIRELGLVQGVLLQVFARTAVLIAKIVLLLVVSTVKMALTVVMISASLSQ